MRTTITGSLSGLAFLVSQIITLPADAFTWGRVVAICVCAICLVLLGVFSRDQGARVVAATVDSDAPPVTK